MVQGERTCLSSPMEVLHPLEPDARRSDYIVTDAAQLEFREMRLVIDREIARFDMELERLQGMMDKLREEQATHLQRRREINAAIAPHKKLPPELISAILLLTYDQKASLKLPPTPYDLKEGPIFLSHLCSRWRQVVCSTPAFWHAVTFSGSRYLDLEGAAHTNKPLWSLDLAKDILSRGTRVLKIDMIESCFALPPGVNLIENLLIPSSTNIHHLTLICCPEVLEPFLSPSPPSFQTLESLDLTCVWTPDTPDQHRACGIVFSNAPSLKRVCIDTVMTGNWNTRSDHQLQSLLIPWRQLTEVSLLGRRVDLADCSDVLRLCHALTKCCLESDADWPSNAICPDSQSQIILPALHTMELHIYQRSLGEVSITPSHFIQNLVLPSLISLTLGLNLASDAINKVNLAGLIVRSASKLECFESTAAIPFLLVEQFLQTVSLTLRELNIGETEISVPTLERIAQGTLLPRLTSIRCCIPSIRAFDALEDLIERRWGSTDDSISDIRTVYAEYPQDRILMYFRRTVKERCEALNRKYADQGRSIKAA
ncbi:hypothetical protein FPV67DRAFT_1527502 [Lyophyllum atratum]|nr:hypothetical protein FPV67DRAFT_1527502 [Lyophyllum atratum]